MYCYKHGFVRANWYMPHRMKQGSAPIPIQFFTLRVVTAEKHRSGREVGGTGKSDVTCT